MKKRAILFLVSVMFIQVTTSKTTLGQDTIVGGSFPSAESFKSMTEVWEIMEDAFKEQLKALDINTDSLMKQMELLKEQMEKFPLDPFVIPDDIANNFGKNFERVVFATTINLKGESKTKEIVVNVEQEIPVMFLIINGSVKSGKAIIEIYDPKGNKQGSFTIENENNENNELVNSSINKSLKKPMLGEWKVKVDSDKAIGNVFITTMQKL